MLGVSKQKFPWAIEKNKIAAAQNFL